MSSDSEGLGGRHKIQPEICNDSVTISAAVLISIKPDAEAVSKPMNRPPERVAIYVAMAFFNESSTLETSLRADLPSHLWAISSRWMTLFSMAPRRSMTVWLRRIRESTTTHTSGTKAKSRTSEPRSAKPPRTLLSSRTPSSALATSAQTSTTR